MLESPLVHFNDDNSTLSNYSLTRTSGNSDRKLCQTNHLKLAFGVDPRVSGFLWVTDCGLVAFIVLVFAEWIDE